ncbi:hypothetical protein [Streptomyces sp. NPDC001020]
MSSPHDFDFFHGEWHVLHRRRTDYLDPDSAWEEFGGTAHCRPLFDGAANIDEIDMPSGLDGPGCTRSPPGSGRSRCWPGAASSS